MAMALSLAVTAGAAFTDQNEIVNDTAVDMCAALNIINGYTDGSFKPEGNVTRAEAAKMITIALNGGKEPTLSASATPTYTDTANHWAAKYIEYCTSLGIVAGDGAGKFNPNGNVKAVELAKMLLIALGYNADTEKFVGKNWDTNVNVIASQKDLYEDLETIDPAAAATRDTAAQMVWNALNVLMVDYKYNLSTDANGNLTSELKVYDLGQTLLEKKFNTIEEVGMLSGISYDADDAEYTYTIGFATTDKNNNPVAAPTFKSTEDYTDLFGMNVKVVYSVDKNGNETVYGIVTKDSSVVVADVIDNVDSLAAIVGGTWAEGDDVEVAGVEYETDANVTGYWFCDGVIANVAAVVDRDGAFKAFDFTAIDNDDNGKIDTLVVYPFSVEKVTYVGTKGITAGTGYTFENDNIYEGVAKDDYAVIVADTYTVDGKDAIVKADVTTAKVTGVKTNAVQLDGAWYTEAVSAAFEVGASYDMVVINNVVLKAEKVDDASEDVLYISEVKADGNNEFASDDVTYDAKAYFVDGTSSVITVSKVGDTEGAKPAAKGLYTYEMDGDNYELTAVSATNKAGFDNYVAGYNATVARFDEDASTLEGKRIADDAVIFVQSKEDGKVEIDVISGKDLKAWGADFGNTAYVLTNEVNGIDYVQVAALIGETAMPGADNDTQYGFVTADSWSTTIEDNGKDKSVVAVQVWTGTETVTLYDKDTTLSLSEGAIVSYEVDGLYADVAALGNAPVAITGFEYVAEGDVVYNTASDKGVTYALDEDVVFIGINTDDVAACEAITMADIQLAQSQSQNNVTANAYVIVDTNNTVETTDDTVIAIFMDVNNELLVNGTAAQYAK